MSKRKIRLVSFSESRASLLCEGCGKKAAKHTPGWLLTGRSRRRARVFGRDGQTLADPSIVACWCPRCPGRIFDKPNPDIAEIKMLIQQAKP